MKNITVILPINDINGEYELSLLDNSIKSIISSKKRPDKLLIVLSKNENLKSIFDKYDFGDFKSNTKIVINDTDNFDYQSQINFGVNNIDTEYFSILEFDDEYSNIYFDNVYKYIDQYYEKVSIFLPIVVDINPDNKFIHFTNEPVWARDFSDEIGFLDNDSLLAYPNFQLSGSIIKTEVFKSLGGLKSNIKMHYNYEFLLRTTYFDEKIMTIPKIGYKKMNMRPNSIFYKIYHSPTEKMDIIEQKFWFNTAKKESYFKNEREIKYDDVTIS
jgi:hypothetical protein